jgi:hypothetical protein
VEEDDVKPEQIAELIGQIADVQNPNPFASGSR